MGSWNRRLAGAAVFALCVSSCSSGPPEHAASDTYSAANFGLFDLPVDQRSLDAVGELGVGWVRLQFRLGEREPGPLLAVVDQLAADGVGVWLTIRYRDPNNVADPELLAASDRGSFPPVDMSEYQQQVRQLISSVSNAIVAREGDPASSLVVQFSNEVIPNDHAPDQPARYFHGSGDEYLAMLANIREAVHSVADIPVAPGGISSSALDLVLAVEAEPGQHADLEPVHEWNDRMLKEGAFDVVDVHIRGELDTMGSRVDWVRQRWNGPLVATEVGGFCDSSCAANEIAEYTPTAQASDLPGRMRTLLDLGVDVVYWASLVESPDLEPQYQAEGLLTEDWEPKPAYAAYQNLIADLSR